MHPRWLDTVVLRTVRDIEAADGALDDDAAVRLAATTSTDRDARLVARAWALATPLGLPAEIARWRAALPWVLAVTALLVALLSHEILNTVTGHDRHINAVGALLAVLGLPTISLLLWTLGLLWPRPLVGGGLARWALALAARLPGLRTPHGLRLLQTGLGTLGQARLLPWVLGLANHVVWTMAFVLLLLGLLLAFSFKAYTLGWETTLLSPGFFADVVTATGWLPAHLGFAVPDAAQALGANATHPLGSDQRPWAWWLIGCTVVYGLLPRLLAAALCWAVWRQRQGRLNTIDTTDPSLRALIDRFNRWDEAVVVDTEHRADTPAQSVHAVQTRAGTAAVIGFELPSTSDWPAVSDDSAVRWSVRIAGSLDERRSVLDRIAQTRPQRVLLVCSAPATPDRGTERFVRAAWAHGAEGGLLLLGTSGVSRWQTWLTDVELGPVQVFDNDPTAAQAWAHGVPAHG